MKGSIRQIPSLGDVAKRVYGMLFSRGRNPEPFPGSAAYWEKRYSTGGNSGVGSYTFFAEFKADVLNGFVATHHVQSVIDFGCGDGNQLRLAKYPAYLGFDVSRTAVSQCQKLFKSDTHKSFRLISKYNGEKADLTLSLDVIYHLVEDAVFEGYMRTLFVASNQYVIIYASDSDDNGGCEGAHVRHRKFTRWIRENLPNWNLVEQLPNRYPYRGDYRKGSFAEFFIYERNVKR
jgi:SAM-dependent methyltransferase